MIKKTVPKGEFAARGERLGYRKKLFAIKRSASYRAGNRVARARAEDLIVRISYLDGFIDGWRKSRYLNSVLERARA